MNRKLLNGFIVLLAAVCCPVSAVSMVVGGSFAAGAAQGLQEPEQVDIEVNVPGFVVEVGQILPIEVQVKNLAGETQSLESVDFYTDFLEGFAIEGSVPPFKGPENYFGLESYIYSQTINPGDTLTVELQAVARQAGSYPLIVDVCINDLAICANYEFAQDFVVQ